VLAGPAKNLSIGHSCSINHGVLLNARDRIEIGDHVRLSAYAQLQTASLEVDTDVGEERRHVSAPIHIGDNVWVAAAAVVVAGVTVREGAVIAAGSVAVRDVPPFTVVGGVPARVLRRTRGPRNLGSPSA